MGKEFIQASSRKGSGEKKGDRGSGSSPGRRRPGDRRARRRTWPSSPCPTRLRQTNNPINSRAAEPRRAKQTGAPYRNRPPGSAGTAAWPRRRRRGRSPTGPGATSARPRQEIGTGQQVCSGIKKQSAPNQKPAPACTGRGTHHREPPVGGADVGGGGVLADAEQGVVAARGRAAAGGIAGSGPGPGVHWEAQQQAHGATRRDATQGRSGSATKASNLGRRRAMDDGWMDEWIQRDARKVFIRAEGVRKISL